jgi:hypothetical protein
LKDEIVAWTKCLCHRSRFTFAHRLTYQSRDR